MIHIFLVTSIFVWLPDLQKKKFQFCQSHTNKLLFKGKSVQTPLIFHTSYSAIPHATCVKILKFTLNFKSLVHYTFSPIWSSSGDSKLMLETAALPSMNTIQNCTHFHAPMCGTFVVLGDSSYVSCASAKSH
jgi:hypothetical protein